jgi:hypothetical protein
VDNNSQGTGTTGFNRSYNSGTVVTLTAPATAGGNNFQKWQKDGVDAGTSASVNVTMDASHTMTAVYVTPVYLLTVKSASPNTGVSITVSPTDVNGAGSGKTVFSRSYLRSTVVTLTAPLTSGKNKFVKWQKDGVDVTTSTSTTVTMDAAHTMTAVYSRSLL